MVRQILKIFACGALKWKKTMCHCLETNQNEPYSPPKGAYKIGGISGRGKVFKDTVFELQFLGFKSLFGAWAPGTLTSLFPSLFGACGALTSYSL